MYFANPSSSTNLNIYKSLLDKYLEEKKDDEVKNMFENIITVTHQLILGEISESKVDHKIYNIVTSLSDFGKPYTRDYFSKINPQQIGIDQLRTLSSIFDSLIVVENAIIDK